MAASTHMVSSERPFDPSYPVHVDARLDGRLSRWLWLVKWLLVIPHYVVLAFLWVAFVVLSMVAFFAILLTGRYPRAIFDFNVGVLRWTWRVGYYAYSALGTDRYPPFSLQDKPDYPAHLDVEYPEHLSRGLVLVKWWLLAIPHYLVLGLFLGGAWLAVGDDGEAAGTIGLITLLVVIAAVALLFTGRYPRSVFDLVLGLNRWALRVAAYAALMTDRYPPFRLDQGGADPATELLSGQDVVFDEGPAAPPATDVPPAVPPTRRGWTAGRVVAVMAASLVALVSLGILAGGVGMALLDTQARDDAGFVMSDDYRLTTDTYGLTSENMELRADTATENWPDALLGDFQITADPITEGEVFLGVAATADVDSYLGTVRHETVVNVEPMRYDASGERAPSTPPAAQDFWVAQASGTGEQAVTWEPSDGDWAIVMMNANGTAGIDAEVAAGAELPALEWLVPLTLVLGGVGLVASVSIIVLVARRAGR